MEIKIDLCENIEQLVQRRAKLTAAPYHGEVLYQSATTAHSGEIIRHLTGSKADGGLHVSAGKKLDSFIDKYVLVIRFD